MRMKKILCWSVAAMALWGCGKFSGADVPIGPSVLTASIESGSPASKTSYGQEGTVGKFTWSEGDQIAVHYSDGTYAILTVDASTGAVNAPSTAARKRDFYSVYPASARVDGHYGNPTLQLKLQESYDISGIVAGTDARGAGFSPCPMVAVNDLDSDLLYFRHAGSLLRLTVIGAPEATSRIAVTLDGKLHGTFTVDTPAGGIPEIKAVTGTSGTVSFTVAGSAGIGPGVRKVVLNLPVPTGVYHSVAIDCYDGTDALTGHVQAARTFTFTRHYGKHFRVIVSENLLLEGEDIDWLTNLNEGEDVTWGDGMLNRGEDVRWK